MTRTLLAASIMLITMSAIPSSTRAQIADEGRPRIGLDLTLAALGTTVDGAGAGFLDGRATMRLSDTWSLGIGGAALWHDKKLTALVTDGTYHLYAGYSGIVAEKAFRITDDFRVTLSLLSGMGITKYQYDKQYRAAKIWTEETIDETTFAVFEPGLALAYKAGSTIWIEAQARYRMTSPVEMLGTDEGVFNGAGYGIGVRWELF